MASRVSSKDGNSLLMASVSKSIAKGLKPTHDTPLAVDIRYAHPTWGFCGRCGMPWNMVRNHTTFFNKYEGCFPLCENCWAELGCPEARIEYYAALIKAWAEVGCPIDEDQKREIQRAVANGG